jgi:parvulin-like peptidyl-prolyl isomerase
VVNKSLVEELNKLKANQHSGVIEAEEGFYLLLLEDRHPTHYKPINEVRAKIETTLVATETDTKQKEWVERLKKKTFVSMF